MSLNFEFSTAGRIRFGVGTLTEVGPAAARMGRRALVVTGASPNRAAPLLQVLDQHHMAHALCQISAEPTTSLLQQARAEARPFRPDLIIGIGGGSALDAGKALAALLTVNGELTDYLEVIGLARPLEAPPLPYIAIPTTAGTGSEVTRNAVIKSDAHGVKVSLRSPLMLPCLAVVDPALAISLPPAETAATGMDALTQLCEAFITRKSNPLVSGMCREGIRCAARSLETVWRHGENLNARQDMALASMISGLALANAGLGAVHGIAAPLGGMFPAPHGAICARLLPLVMAANLRALEEPEAPEWYADRFTELARLLTGSARADSTDAIRYLQDLCETLQIPPLSDYGITPDHLPQLARQSQKASSMKGNPVTLSVSTLQEILAKAL